MKVLCNSNDLKPYWIKGEVYKVIEETIYDDHYRVICINELNRSGHLTESKTGWLPHFDILDYDFIPIYCYKLIKLFK